MNEIDKLCKKLLKYPNVTGYAKMLQKRIRKGETVDEQCIQVHVREKVSEKMLRMQDIIPRALEGMPIDVVFVGDLKIPLPPKRKVMVAEKTGTIRPLVAGISVGNVAITAGTLGAFMEKAKSPDKGEVFLGSNSHVLCDEPKNETSGEKRIFQPGRYDGGSEAVAEYYWHKQLNAQETPSTCGISEGITGFLNSMSKALSRKTRFITVVEETNLIDFAVARLITPWENKFFDVEFPPEKFEFAGLGFAGSDQVSLACKSKYILEEGYKPLGYEICEVNAGDLLHKTGRTSCYSKAAAILESAYEVVSYGAYSVAFDDVVVTAKMLEPGDSGSSVWREK